jgi:MFS family permease
MTDSQNPPSSNGLSGWLNRSTLGVSLASLFSDVSHELATAVLPAVLLSLGGGPAALGLIEGSADGLSAIAKLWGGIAADRAKRRKPLASIGYLVTALGIAAIGLTTRWWQVLLCRMGAWIGRGTRSAPRDVLMIEAVDPAHAGKAFGMERAGDALGAVLGPLLALALLAQGLHPRQIVVWSLLPGLLAFLSITFLVVERPFALPAVRRSLRGSWDSTGAAFHRYLGVIFLFGSGDFSRTLLILYATQHLTGGLFGWQSATLAVALYVLHNAVSSLAAFPLGALVDRIGRRPVIRAGYFFAAAVTLGFALLPPAPGALIALFIGSGVYIACEEVAEKAFAAVMASVTKGAGMGLLAAVNGLGDLVSSALVGLLWALAPARPSLGFFAAAALQFAGACLIGRVRATERDALTHAPIGSH